MSPDPISLFQSPLRRNWDHLVNYRSSTLNRGMVRVSAWNSWSIVLWQMTLKLKASRRNNWEGTVFRLGSFICDSCQTWQKHLNFWRLQSRSEQCVKTGQLPSSKDWWSPGRFRRWKIFFKLDMTQTCQQLELEESSKQYTTINTHQGLSVKQTSLWCAILM